MAAALKISPASVKTTVHRARDQVAAKVARDRSAS